MTLGESVRNFRKKSGLTIKDVSIMSGIATSLISQIENDKANPSLSTLYALAKALNAEIGALLPEDGEKQVSCVVRSMERKMFRNAKGFQGFLLTNKQYEEFEAHSTVMAPGATSADSPELHKYTKKRYEFCYITIGKAVLTIDGETYVLNTGDCAIIDAKSSHCISNPSNSITEVIWVMIR
jgi:transcriptional regulator with XRE-family HTH domain